jgi:tmRNA-binding protein
MAEQMAEISELSFIIHFKDDRHGVIRNSVFRWPEVRQVSKDSETRCLHRIRKLLVNKYALQEFTKKNNVKDYSFVLAIYDSKLSPGFPKGKTKFAETEEEWGNLLLVYSGMLAEMVLQGE